MLPIILLLLALLFPSVESGSVELFPGFYLACGGRTCSQNDPVFNNIGNVRYNEWNNPLYYNNQNSVQYGYGSGYGNTNYNYNRPTYNQNYNQNYRYNQPYQQQQNTYSGRNYYSNTQYYQNSIQQAPQQRTPYYNSGYRASYQQYGLLVATVVDAEFKLLSSHRGKLSRSALSNEEEHASVRNFVSGQNFIFSVINAHLLDNDNSYTENITVVISNGDSVSADITITSPFVALQNNQFTVPPKTIYSYSLPPEIQTNYRNVDVGYVKTSNKSISLVAKNAKVTVVVRNSHSDGLSEDDYVIYPTCTLGSQYHSVGDESLWSGKNATNIFSITALQDNTLVATYPRLTVVNFTINAGEVLTLSSDIYPMSNYRILASAPVAVTSGAVCGFGYYNQNQCNHEAVMLFPLADSGVAFPYTQFKSEDNGELMVFVTDNRTIVSLDGVPWDRFDAIEYGLLRVQGSVFITMDKPGYVIAIGSTRSDFQGSPFLAHIPSLSQYTNQTYLQVQTGLVGRTFASHYIRIQTDVQMTDGISVDGWPINALFYERQGKSASYIADWSINAGTHVIQTTKPGVRFSATVYGFAPFTAYAYTAGMDLPVVGAC
ncbi:unnamed protein product, partial [Mesorhabditis spiculigera]